MAPVWCHVWCGTVPKVIRNKPRLRHIHVKTKTEKKASNFTDFNIRTTHKEVVKHILKWAVPNFNCILAPWLYLPQFASFLLNTDSECKDLSHCNQTSLLSCHTLWQHFCLLTYSCYHVTEVGGLSGLWHTDGYHAKDCGFTGAILLDRFYILYNLNINNFFVHLLCISRYNEWLLTGIRSLIPGKAWALTLDYYVRTGCVL
jgi:hypothetical protein